MEAVFRGCGAQDDPVFAFQGSLNHITMAITTQSGDLGIEAALWTTADNLRGNCSEISNGATFN